MSERPDCYPTPPPALLAAGALGRLPALDVLTSPVPSGVFDSPVDERHVLCLHLGAPVPVTYRAAHGERRGMRLHGQFCVVPAGSSTRWTLAQPARSLLLRLAPALLADMAESLGVTESVQLEGRVHLRDAQIERIGWMMQAEERDGYPNGRLFADSLATALAARLFTLQSRATIAEPRAARALPPRRLRQVLEYIEAHLDENLTLAELAEVAGFGLSQFKALFREATGAPVHRFVLLRRIERARTLLVAGGRTVTDIALETGFAHASHLARAMRRELGVSPKQVADASR